MKLNNWLKRKYPNYYKIIIEIFAEEDIEKYIKKDKYDLAILLSDFDIYKKGTLFLVKKSANCVEDCYDYFIWDGTYDIWALFYCGKPYTESGFHHVRLFSKNDYILLKR